MAKLVHFSIRVPRKIKRALDQQAKQEGHNSVSLVARTVLTTYVNEGIKQMAMTVGTR